MAEESIDLENMLEKNQKTNNVKGNTEQGDQPAREAENKETVPNAGSINIFCPIKEGQQKLKVTRKIAECIKEAPSEYRAAFYSFLAAMLGRACTKACITIKKHIKDAASKNFAHIYTYGDMLIELPEPSDSATRALSIGMKPGGPAIISLLKTFLMTRYEKGVLISDGVIGVLDFTLLVPSSYNGMQIIRLAREACRIERIKDLSELLRYLSCSPTQNSINRIYEFYDIYHTENTQTEKEAEGGKIVRHEGIMAPWSRLFNDKYWSVLSIKAHSVLGYLLAALVEGNHPEIWNVKSFSKKKKLKYDVKVWADSCKEFRIDQGYKGVPEGSMFAGSFKNVPCPSLDFLC